ncbi:VOC family protein [Phycicoccus sp. M110.8]|uniref:VOC family protein n=1 Tax=Phycicoccus sp. M110.8 TaxID=3075433 RepID=UPI0028FDBE5B|nr:VOC family protein [Phycicoccus sp. M110.8]MDU0312231.1 VOC family protein [Phycicoccus sp. M110.8]
MTPNTHSSTPTATFASVRVITDDVPRLVAFYELVTDRAARWATPTFAELSSDRATLAVAGTETLALFGEQLAEPGANRSVIIEWHVDDVDAEHERLGGSVGAVEQVPTTMPWGNRSMLLRDPDGNLVNLFTPVSDAARERFSPAR